MSSKKGDDIFSDLISKVAQPFADPKFIQYHNMLQLGESIKSLKAGKPVNFEVLVRKNALNTKACRFINNYKISF